jgi:hypothetical protein
LRPTAAARSSVVGHAQAAVVKKTDERSPTLEAVVDGLTGVAVFGDPPALFAQPALELIACRLTVTYAGFEGEVTLLEELHQRGLKQPQIGPNLYAGDVILMFWSHEPVAPWQTEAPGCAPCSW